ncbi:hypothetical protein ACFFKC_04150 [Pseudoduganella danionis]|uniref:Uncharacterized protein n=2 Tax=Pseudoduganella danionis TaxID=1890295 RepID=A0ABW9SI48_9BURK|nr:hypothetical protein [Pseudoduganella danionis]
MMALLSIHASVYGEGRHTAGAMPEEALKMALFYAAHPREITLEHIQRHTLRKLKLSECADYGSLRQCTYSPAEGGIDASGLQTVTVSYSAKGASRGGSILWRFSPNPCLSAETVTRLLGKTSFTSELPPTFYQAPGTPESIAPSPEYKTYKSKDWNPEVRVETVTTKCLEMIALNAQLTKE